jgi:hypothetical protein
LPQLEVQTDLIERDRFKANLALKFPGLLRAGGPRAFAQDHVGWILKSLESPEFVGEIAAVHSAGMYINLTLSDAWLLQAAKTVVEAGEGYGASSALAQERYVVDYSSPNIAKTLHAGHIRSTIIGDVLSNVLQEAFGSATSIARRPSRTLTLLWGITTRGRALSQSPEMVQRSAKAPCRCRVPTDGGKRHHQLPVLEAASRVCSPRQREFYFDSPVILEVARAPSLELRAGRGACLVHRRRRAPL